MVCEHVRLASGSGMSKPSARLRLDVSCNDPSNGLFASRAEQFCVTTWEGEDLEFEGRHTRAPRFAELPGAIRWFRREWPILASKKWVGNWCWNAYWLAPSVLVDLLEAVKRGGAYDCTCGPSQMFEDWNDLPTPLNRPMWAANLWGRHSIGVAE